MHAAVITGQGTIELQEVPEPTPRPGGVVVDIAFCGICGTDVHAYAHGGPYPATLCGHEWSGIVSEVAADVRSLSEGERVSVGMIPACGVCAECRAGLTDWCMTATSSLVHDPAGSAHGGYAPRIAVSAARVVPVPPGLSDESAAMIEPATVAFHGVRNAGIRVGDTVVVQGAGPIGAFALQWARVCGAAQVVVVEPSPARAALARDLRADVVVGPGEEAATAVMDRTGGRGADVVVECAGVASAIQSAVDLVRRGGHVSLIGLSDLPATINPGVWLVKEVVVRGSVAYVRAEFDPCIAMLAAGTVRAAPLHTSTVDLDGIAGAFALLAGGSNQETKILVRPPR
jgi:(R,R)-butanediol dehydrogenase/meso-butanediol dehydrogenase/diacetyl reductase